MKPLNLNFKPSTILFVLVLLMSAMSSWIVCLVPLSIILIYVILLLLWLLAAYTLMSEARLFPWSIVGLNVNVKNELNILQKNGQKLTNLALSNDSVVTPLLTIVGFRAENATWLQRLFHRSVLILPDSVEEQAFRQLRVWLLWGAKRNR